MITRRDYLTGMLAAALAAPRLSSATVRGEGQADFSRRTVVDAARELAKKPFEPPAPVPDALKEISYDDYRAIRYRKSEAIWANSSARFNMELFAPGFLYTSPIDVSIVENGTAYALNLTRDSFELPSEKLVAPMLEAGKFAGFRLHYPLNNDEYKDEFVVFQGASYFRAVSAKQLYGLSARGLAIDVAEQKGEEYPMFREFWIERPSTKQENVVVHALLDSKSVAGAYRFGIFPGDTTRMDVDLSLFPRVDLNHVGIGPLTSMFMHDGLDKASIDDFRPSVHDSQALVMHSGSDERIWRGLTNPAQLQGSSFRDRNPKGFGLIQRDRRFAEFEDLEAKYERRPSAWVQPIGDWGDGHVQLVEIPSDSEANDNIVAYWRPADPLPAGKRYDRRYRLMWPNDSPANDAVARVLQTRAGQVIGGTLREFVIDYTGLPDVDRNAIKLDASSSAGHYAELLVIDNPHIHGFRAVLKFEPPEEGVAELRMQPKLNDQPCGETWLHRWIGA